MSALGLGWRPEVAGAAIRHGDLAFVEVIAESMRVQGGDAELPLGLQMLRERGVEVIPHGIGLSLGSADPPSKDRIAVLADAARALDAPMVSEHLAFVRARTGASGHLLPVPRTRTMASVLVENIRRAQDSLPVPLAVEPIATLFAWPDAEMDEADFVTEVIERSGAPLLLDLANLYVNGRNFGFDPLDHLDRLPLDRLAYVHVAGGQVRGGLHHDTHATTVWPEVLALTAELIARVPGARVMLERDDHFPGDDALIDELRSIEVAMAEGRSRAAAGRVHAASADVRSPRAVDEVVDLAHARRKLRGEQARVIDALVRGKSTPDGFDAGRIAVAAESLQAKRAREALDAWPALRCALGPSGPERFAAYAAKHAAPESGGPWADGFLFACRTINWQTVDDRARVEWREACAHWRAKGGKVVPRRWSMFEAVARVQRGVESRLPRQTDRPDVA